MSTPVAQRLCAGTRYRLTAGISAVMINSVPVIAPATIRIRGVIRLLSKAYLTKKTTPRNSANPPIHAKSFTPRIDSQLIAGGDVVAIGGVLGAGVGGGCCRNAGSGGGITGLSALGAGRLSRCSSNLRTRRFNSSTLHFSFENCAATTIETTSEARPKRARRIISSIVDL